jgi:hypothetical protein
MPRNDSDVQDAIYARREGQCRFCGADRGGVLFSEWVKPTFTDWDKLLPGNIVCEQCLFWFNEASEELANLTGKNKPQRMRNYSHFVTGEIWTPLSKGDKTSMRNLLLTPPFPDLAVIAESGQKHIAFRAVRNAPDSLSGWVQFEEQQIWVDPASLLAQLEIIEALYTVFSKTEIETGRYIPNRILNYGVDLWRDREQIVKSWRGTPLFSLSIFLAQRSDDDSGGIETTGSGSSDGDLAGNVERPQEQIPDDDLGSIQQRDPERSLHDEFGELRQLSLW